MASQRQKHKLLRDAALEKEEQILDIFNAVEHLHYREERILARDIRRTNGELCIKIPVLAERKDIKVIKLAQMLPKHLIAFALADDPIRWLSELTAVPMGNLTADIYLQHGTQLLRQLLRIKNKQPRLEEELLREERQEEILDLCHLLHLSILAGRKAVSSRGVSDCATLCGLLVASLDIVVLCHPDAKAAAVAIARRPLWHVFLAAAFDVCHIALCRLGELLREETVMSIVLPQVPSGLVPILAGAVVNIGATLDLLTLCCAPVITARLEGGDTTDTRFVVKAATRTVAAATRLLDITLGADTAAPTNAAPRANPPELAAGDAPQEAAVTDAPQGAAACATDETPPTTPAAGGSSAVVGPCTCEDAVTATTTMNTAPMDTPLEPTANYRTQDEAVELEEARLRAVTTFQCQIVAQGVSLLYALSVAGEDVVDKTFLDAVAEDPEARALFEEVQRKVISGMIAAIHRPVGEVLALPPGALEHQMLRMIEELSNDSNFRSQVLSSCAEAVAYALTLSQSDFASRWCGGDEAEALYQSSIFPCPVGTLGTGTTNPKNLATKPRDVIFMETCDALKAAKVQPAHSPDPAGATAMGSCGEAGRCVKPTTEGEPTDSIQQCIMGDESAPEAASQASSELSIALFDRAVYFFKWIGNMHYFDASVCNAADELSFLSKVVEALRRGPCHSSVEDGGDQSEDCRGTEAKLRLELAVQNMLTLDELIRRVLPDGFLLELDLDLGYEFMLGLSKAAKATAASCGKKAPKRKKDHESALGITRKK